MTKTKVSPFYLGHGVFIIHYREQPGSTCTRLCISPIL